MQRALWGMRGSPRKAPPPRKGWIRRQGMFTRPAFGKSQLLPPATTSAPPLQPAPGSRGPGPFHCGASRNALMLLTPNSPAQPRDLRPESTPTPWPTRIQLPLPSRPSTLRGPGQHHGHNSRSTRAPLQLSGDRTRGDRSTTGLGRITWRHLHTSAITTTRQGRIHNCYSSLIDHGHRSIDDWHCPWHWRWGWRSPVTEMHGKYLWHLLYTGTSDRDCWTL